MSDGILPYAVIEEIPIDKMTTVFADGAGVKIHVFAVSDFGIEPLDAVDALAANHGGTTDQHAIEKDHARWNGPPFSPINPC